MEMDLIIKFLVLTFVVSGTIIFFLHRTLVASTEGAVNRLNEEIAAANKKQIELSNKIKAADEELNKRQTEARELANKMRSAAEEESKAEREKIITKAREESEDIINKANTAKEKIRIELEKEAEIKVINQSMEILNTILNEKSKASLGDVLLNDFIESLKEVDMNRIGPDIKSAELVTLAPINDQKKSEIAQLIQGKLNREIAIEAKTDENIGGGAVLKFGSMALDGSIRFLINETGRKLIQQVEEK